MEVTDALASHEVISITSNGAPGSLEEQLAQRGDLEEVTVDELVQENDVLRKALASSRTFPHQYINTILICILYIMISDYVLSR